MAFLSTTDSKENFDITLFPENYRRFMANLEKGKFYLISGKVSERNDALQMLADRVIEVEETDRKLWLNLEDASHNTHISRILRSFLEEYKSFCILLTQKPHRLKSMWKKMIYF